MVDNWHCTLTPLIAEFYVAIVLEYGISLWLSSCWQDVLRIYLLFSWLYSLVSGKKIHSSQYCLTTHKPYPSQQLSIARWILMGQYTLQIFGS